MTDRIVNTALGLAIGDASGWPATLHRSSLLPPWTRRLRRELDVFGEEHKLSTTALPFSLNQPVEALRLGPANDSEWFVFSADHLIRRAGDSSVGPAEHWVSLAGRRDEIWAGIGVKSALDNLAAGVGPPASGNDQPHFADGSALGRAAAFGLACSGQPDLASRQARSDARVTNAEDGVWAASSFAAAISVASAGGSLDAVVAAALAELPEGSQSRRLVGLALDLAASSGSAFGLVPEIDLNLVDHVYSYPLGAAHYLAAALAMVVAAEGSFEVAVPGSACIARFADAVPALAGALCGALGSPLPTTWIDRCETLVGCCLPELAGRSVRAVGEELSRLAHDSSNNTATPNEGKRKQFR